MSIKQQILDKLAIPTTQKELVQMLNVNVGTVRTTIHRLYSQGQISIVGKKGRQNLYHCQESELRQHIRSKKTERHFVRRQVKLVSKTTNKVITTHICSCCGHVDKL